MGGYLPLFAKKNEAGSDPGPKALGNGGVSSRKTREL
jgi:hypothetical protein